MGARTEMRTVAEIETGAGTRTRSVKAERRKKREKLHKGETSVERQKRWQETVRSVATDSDNLENSKDAEREAQGTQGLSKNCTHIDRVCPLCRA